MADEKEEDFTRANLNSLHVGSDFPLYDVVDCKEPSSLPGKRKGSNPDYSIVSVATMNKENIYSEGGTTTRVKEDTVTVDKKLMCLVVTVVSVLVLMLVFGGLIVALFLEIANLKSQIASSQETSVEVSSANMQQIGARLEEIERSKIHQLNTSIINWITEQLMLQSDVSRQINVSIGERLGEFKDIENIQDHQIQQLNDSIAESFDSLMFAGVYVFHPAASCAALPPSSPSGYYWVRASNGSAVHVYCDMTRSCGGVTGGWRRVAELDMTNSSHQCPSGLGQRNDSNKRTCVRNSDSAGCSSVSTATVEYSRVCEKITAYQFGSTNAFSTVIRGLNLNIDSYYVDGVSLTRGNPRQHIWTFAAGIHEISSYPEHNCPCIIASPETQPPAFVGTDYFCDTGSTGGFRSGLFYGDDPLWDGAGCGPLSTCCSFNNPPWFSKQLPQPTTDNIEMRVCRDQLASNEDIAIETVEIYVR